MKIKKLPPMKVTVLNSHFISASAVESNNTDTTTVATTLTSTHVYRN